jgi:hypothetical protein
MGRFVACGKYKIAKKTCPMAVKIVAVKGGYLAFVNWADYAAWKREDQE